MGQAITAPRALAAAAGVGPTRLLVDGNGLACRLWWAHGGRVPERFTETVERLTESYAPAEPTVAWDAQGPTWRREVMPAYKAGRSAKPDLLVRALAECRRTPFHHLEAPGFEADDLIATLAALDDAPVLILTADKDLAQLVTPRCHLLDWDGRQFGPAEVERRWGVPPERIRHLLSWMGDASDGLPGVRGVGQKRGVPRALAGEVGDPLTYELVGLATVPAECVRSWTGA
jgi:DNA polymerase-1